MTGLRTRCRPSVFALLLVTATSSTAQITPELIRERTEREWTIKAEKMHRHLLPLMRRHDVDLSLGYEI